MSQYFIKVRSCGAENQEPEYWSRQIVSASQSNLFWNSGSVGIGVPNPLAKLQVDGNVGIGTAYAAIAPPINGLIVSGNVGIGTANPQAKLEVTGTINGTSLAVTGAVTSSGGGIGYATGAGGAVTQATSRTTAVTLSKLTGTITLFAGILAANTAESFTLTNTFIAATDHVIVSQIGGTVALYNLQAVPAAGSAVITIRNPTAAASVSESPIIKFTVIKAVVA